MEATAMRWHVASGTIQIRISTGMLLRDVVEVLANELLETQSLMERYGGDEPAAEAMLELAEEQEALDLLHNMLDEPME